MSLPEDLADDAVEVKADGFMKIEAISAYGVSLIPQDGNAGGYPLIAYVNGDERTRHVIRGPQVLRSESGELITTVKVDAREGGGVAGDTWDVTVLPHPSSRLEARFRHDVDGFLATRAPGARTLFDFNSRVDHIPYMNAFANNQTGSFRVIPSAPHAFTKDGEGVWDVSRFNHLLLVVDQLAAAGLDWSFQAFVDPMYATDWNPLEINVGCGTDNEFGIASATPWPAVTIGFIELGASAAATTVLTRTRVGMPPFARFRFEVAINNENWMAIGWGGTFELRIRALAW
jgi:hypothetical protein